jgi:hypothetical protein
LSANKNVKKNIFWSEKKKRNYPMSTKAPFLVCHFMLEKDSYSWVVMMRMLLALDLCRMALPAAEAEGEQRGGKGEKKGENDCFFINVGICFRMR